MTIIELRDVLSLSSGTIGKELKTHLYSDVDRFIRVMSQSLIGDILKGQLAAYGDNVLMGLKHAVICYNRHFRN